MKTMTCIGFVWLLRLLRLELYMDAMEKWDIKFGAIEPLCRGNDGNLEPSKWDVFQHSWKIRRILEDSIRFLGFIRFISFIRHRDGFSRFSGLSWAHVPQEGEAKEMSAAALDNGTDVQVWAKRIWKPLNTLGRNVTNERRNLQTWPLPLYHLCHHIFERNLEWDISERTLCWPWMTDDDWKDRENLLWQSLILFDLVSLVWSCLILGAAQGHQNPCRPSQMDHVMPQQNWRCQGRQHSPPWEM